MDMSFQEIASSALDEWNNGVHGVTSGSPTEDANKMGISETAMAQALAGKSQSEQAVGLQEHDAIYHKTHPYNPQTSSCKLRQKLVETQKAIGAPISERQAEQMGISKKDLDAGNHTGNAMVEASRKGVEGSDPAINEIREMRKRIQSLTGDERTKADAKLQTKCIEFAKKNLGEAEGEAVEGLFNKMKMFGKDMALKIKESFAKRDDSNMSDVAQEVKETVLGEADSLLNGGKQVIENPEDSTSESAEEIGNVNTAESVNQNISQEKGYQEAESNLTHEQLNEEISDLEEKLQGVEKGSGQESAIKQRIGELKAMLSPQKKLNRQEKEDIYKKACEEYDKLVLSGASPEELNPYRKKRNAAKEDLESHQDLEIDLLRKRNSIQEKLDAAKKTYDELQQQQRDFKDGNDGAKQVKTSDMEAAKAAVDQLQQAYKSADDAYQNYHDPDNQVSEEENNHGELESQEQQKHDADEREIDGQIYVDIDSIEAREGFDAAMKAAEEAGLLGKEIIFRMKNADKRWKEIHGNNEQQNKDLKTMENELRRQTVVADWKKKAEDSSDPRVRDAYNQAALMLENGDDLGKVFKYKDSRLDEINRNVGAHVLNQEKIDQMASKTANEAMSARGKEASRIAKEAREDIKLQMSKDKEDDRKRHQKFQEDLAKSKDAYKRAQDAKKELPDTAAKLNPDVVQAIADARDNCKDPIERGELNQVITNLQNTRDPSKALQWQNKADQIINGKSKKNGSSSGVETPVNGIDHDNGGVMSAQDGANYKPIDTSSLTRVQDSNGTLNGESAAKSHIAQVCTNNGLSNPNITVKPGATDTRMTIDLSNFTGNGETLGAKILSGIGNVVGTQNADGKTKEKPSCSYDDNTKRLTITFQNDKKGDVSFTGILDDPKWGAFKNSNKGKGTFFVGRNDDGDPICGTFDDLVHLLIAGETGSGKSVKLNTLLSSAIESSSPDDLKLIMIDPKGVELSNYGGDPHVIGDVITDMDDAAGKFNWAANEMDNRYNLMKKAGVKDIKEYNALAAAGKLPQGLPKKLPRIGVVVEEFADLMATHGRNVEASIKRLSSKARAAGIHLIIATQRPDKDVVTGIIKANIPSRMALHTADATNASIIGVKGAENLTAKGPFILKTPDGDIRRGEGAMIGNDDNKKLIEASKKAYGGSTSPSTPAPTISTTTVPPNNTAV